MSESISKHAKHASKTPFDLSHKSIAIIGGVSYLGIIILGIFAEFFVRLQLIIPDDSTSTLNNLRASEFLFNLSIISDIIMIMLDITVAWVLYVLLKNTNKNLAMLSAFFRLIHAAVYSSVIMTLIFISLLINDNDYLPEVNNGQLILVLREAHSYGYDLGLIFFGIHCLLLGYLINISNIIPKTIGYLMAAAGLVYLIGSFTRFISPDHVETVSMIYIVALAAELSMAGWLLVKGSKLR